MTTTSPHAETASARCPACARVVAPESRFCRECGERLRAPDVADGSELKARTFSCGSCGARVEVAEGLVTASCPFCDTSYVAEGTLAAARERPDTMLPFRVEAAAAREQFLTWRRSLRMKWLRRPGLEEARIEDLRGVYVPCWVLTAEARSRWAAEIGETYVVSTGKETVKKTAWYPLEGEHLCEVGPDVLSGSRGLPQEWLDFVKPFGIEDRVSFREEYLSGWSAEAYGIDRDGAWASGAKRFAETVKGLLGRFMPGDKHRGLRFTVAYDECKTELLYLPLWVAAYTLGEKPCRFVVNGRTARCAGEAPWSGWRITALVVGIVAALIAAGFVLLEVIS